MVKDDKNTAIYVAYDDARPHDPTTPEKSLLVAILMSALSDLKKPGEEGKKAIEYFLDADEEYIFSFQSVCDHLSIDPKKVLMLTGLKSQAEARKRAEEEGIQPAHTA